MEAFIFSEQVSKLIEFMKIVSLMDNFHGMRGR